MLYSSNASLITFYCHNQESGYADTKIWNKHSCTLSTTMHRSEVSTSLRFIGFNPKDRYTMANQSKEIHVERIYYKLFQSEFHVFKMHLNQKQSNNSL